MMKLLALGVVVAVVLFFGNRFWWGVAPVPPAPPETALYRDASQPIEARVADLLSYMTLEEKIGQMTLVEKNSIKQPSDIATYHLGALLSGAGAKPEVNTPEGWRAMIDGYQAQAQGTRLRIPLLYGVDAIHGHAHVPTATVFPHAIGLGAARDVALTEAVAAATAEELVATGVNWSFSPNLDLPQDIRWGRVYEAFSDDPALVSDLGVAYLRGLQNSPDETTDRVQVLATPKHYLGLGGMGWGTSQNRNFKIDQGVTPADEALLRSVYLPPFAAAVEEGALSIMVGLNTWGEARTIIQKELLTDLLKDEVGFKGFLVSDWYGVHEGRTNKFWATVEAINAGVDMVMLPFEYHAFARDMRWANRLGLISDERIDDAVGRILYAKFALGLFDTEVAVPREEVSFPNPAHRALAREAVAQSLVLLRNEGAVLPLSPWTPSILVAGSAADNTGRQSGAWTVEWQGIDGEVPGEATSILAALKERVAPGTKVQYDRLGNFATGTAKAAVGIAVVGEAPYAEGWGDTPYPILSDEDRAAIASLQARSERVVVVIVSGRPLLIAEEVESLNALVAAWLPGSEGAGVVDVLFGDKPFVGTLPLPWPLRTEQLPISPTGETADGTAVLYPRGFGLRY